MKTYYLKYGLLFLIGVYGCNQSPVQKTAVDSLTVKDSSHTVITDSLVARDTSLPVKEQPKDTVAIQQTHLKGTTTVSGNFILFLQEDEERFDAESKDEASGSYESDSDFGFGIEGTIDSVAKNKKYKNIKVLVSTERYITIKDCAGGPITIDRDTIDVGYILSSPDKAIRTDYGEVHSGDYLGEINDYFGIK